jgi:hypothetical protein
VRAQVGELAIRAVTLAYPDGGSYAAGSDAELRIAIANDGGQDDTLTGISGQGFSGAVFTDAASAAALTAAPTSASASATSSAATPTATGTPVPGSTTASASPATSTAPPAPVVPPAPTELAIPAGQTVFVGTGTDHITLTGLQSPLTTGQYVTLTLHFQKAGDVTLKATVANPSSPLSHSDAYNFDQAGG